MKKPNPDKEKESIDSINMFLKQFGEPDIYQSIVLQTFFEMLLAGNTKKEN